MNRIVRTLAIFSVAVPSLVAGQSPLAQPVSLDIPPSRLPEALKAIESRTGVSLLAGTPLANEVVMIRVRDVPLADVMNRLAETVGAEWQREGAGYRLSRSVAQEQRDARAAAQARQRAIQKAIDAALAELRRRPRLDEATVRDMMGELPWPDRPTAPPGGGRGAGERLVPRIDLRGALVATPGGRAAAQIASLIGAGELARIEPGQRVVYSTRPTPMQRPLVGAALGIVQRMIEEERVFQEVTLDMVRSRFPAIDDAMSRGGRSRNEPSGPIAKVLFIVTPGRAEGRPGRGAFRAPWQMPVEIVALDAQGRQVTRNLGLLEISEDEAAPTGDAGGEPIAFSDEAKAWARAIQFGSRRPGGGPFGGGPIAEVVGAVFSFGPEDQDDSALKVADRLRQAMADPLQNEPLAFYVGPAFLAAAGDENLIASLPDDLLTSLAPAVNAGITTGNLLARAASEWNLDVRREGGWMLVAPENRTAARFARIDRAALAAVLSVVSQGRNLSLDELAAYAARRPRGATSWDLALWRILNPVSAGTQASQLFGNYEALRLWGLLDTGARQTLLRGQALSLTAIGGPLRAHIDDLVWNSWDGPRQMASGAPATGAASSVSVAAVAPPGRRGGPMGAMMFANVERTELLPNGIPQGATLRLRVAADPAGAVWAQHSSGQGRILSLGELAFQRARERNPGLLPGPDRGPRFDLYQPAKSTIYVFELSLAPNVNMVRALNDYQLDPSARPGSYDALPGSIRDRVEEIASGIRRGVEEGQSRLEEMGIDLGRRPGRGRGGGGQPPSNPRP